MTAQVLEQHCRENRFAHTRVGARDEDDFFTHCDLAWKTSEALNLVELQQHRKENRTPLLWLTDNMDNFAVSGATAHFQLNLKV
jgi:hypothetical protein